MCGIAGFCNAKIDYLKEKAYWQEILDNMNKAQKHRGPNGQGKYISSGCGLAHVRLSIIDLKTGDQPIIKKFCDKNYTIIYNGEIYNMMELKGDLMSKGIKFNTKSDTEIILMGHLVYGCDYVKKLNGIFAYAIWDDNKKILYLYRDRLGIKPLFYTIFDGTLIFSSEIKGILQYPGFKAKLDKDGLCEVFGLGPAKTYGKGVFKDIFEVLPGHFLKMSSDGLKQSIYWKLKSKPHKDSFEETIDKTSYLIYDSIKRQMISDIPICTFLSGGVDSSIVTSICATELQKQGKKLNTFSFDFVGNNINFKSNDFQPSQDRPWVEKMTKFSKTNHIYLECQNDELIKNLYSAVDAKDLPCMADVESSLLYFCSKVVKYNKVTLTGECADEIFGGYPWFHKQEMFNANTFPWSMDLSPRKVLLSDETINSLPIDDYVKNAYQKTIAETPLLNGENATEKRRRELSYLNIKWFMATLLDRMD
ncbi:MAG: asparagine synthase (glutamine-hydrolyzing), partial [Oscillospiraceae bacterium]|nr:asparagine synthase (glutamine-hydrolyzing) [Oscillospiraceae bacterium]